MLTVGENFLRYKVLAFIGGGGMGDVYLAKDQQLERKVAIKLLRKNLSRLNDDGIERFMIEARSASALNHPNIITIYEIGESDGAHYIASEYIEGMTLHERLQRDDLSLMEKLSYGIQVAEALTAAHNAGIVHRDIKPENIMIREDGYIKVLDFGLAKLTEGNPLTDIDAETKKMFATDPGIILGTVAYMSPEQTRGKALDGRSDVWSLGVVLYEMVTGRRPFEGDTTSDMIAAILKGEPAPITKDDGELPRALERIIGKTLRKDREDRYQHIKDLLIDLKDLRRDLEASRITESGRLRGTDGSVARVATADAAMRAQTTAEMGTATGSVREALARQISLHPLLILLVIATMIALTALAMNLAWPATQRNAFDSMRFTRLTTSGNAEGGLAALSRDGRYVAYGVREQGKQSLWVRQTATAGTAQVIPAAETSFSGVTFSPDGDHIYYTAADPQGKSGIFVVPTLGGTSRRVMDDAFGPISFSPDSASYAFTRGSRELLIARTDGSGSRTVATAAAGEAFWIPAFSPDGKTVAITVFSSDDSKVRLSSVDLGDGRQSPIGGQSWLRVSGLAWLPDGNLVLAGRDADTQYSQLWSISPATGAVSRITNDPTNYIGLSLAADGRSAVSVHESRVSNVWITDAANPEKPRKVTTDVGRDEGLAGIAWTPSGKIVYTTRLTGTQDIWIVDPAGGTNRQLTFSTGSNTHPTVSPDERTILFASDRTGNAELWRMGVDGSNPVQLTKTTGRESRPAFTQDGRWVIYQYADENRQVSVWRIPAEGGEPERLTENGVARPAVSPGGKTFAGEIEIDGRPQLSIIPIDGGAATRTLDLPSVTSSPLFLWAPDGSSIVYIDNASGSHLVEQPISGGQPRKVLGGVDARIFSFAVSPNGRGFAVAMGSETSDVVIVSDFR